MDWIDIGSTPSEEPCIQMGDPKWTALNQRAEALIYKHQLEREFPYGVFRLGLVVHDFGTYYEVYAQLDEDEASDVTQAAWEAESDAQPYWDMEALAELRKMFLAGYVRDLSEVAA